MASQTRVAVGALLCACAALLAGPAAAIDGETLINQQAALAGNVTPGDSPGYPITIGRRGKYKLSGDLAVPDGVHGIEVTAADVTIDFNGFSMRSAPAGAARIGISGTAARLTVMNGTILNFGRGGIVSVTAFAVVEGMRVIGTREVGVFVGNDARVLKSTIANSRFAGIECGARCLIQGNVVTGTSLGSGILLQQGGVVLGNVIVNNAEFGIFAYQAPVGFGNNSVVSNGTSVSPGVVPLHPNHCTPACP